MVEVVGGDQVLRPRDVIEVMQDESLGEFQRGVVLVAAYRSGQTVHHKFAEQAATDLRLAAEKYTGSEPETSAEEVGYILGILDFLAGGDENLADHTD